MTPSADPPPGRSDRHHLEDLVAPALARALTVGRAWAADPAGPDVPAALRPLLRFRRLTGPARQAAMAALEDDHFRAAVAEDADPDELGRASWLFLARPEGWEAEVEEALTGAVAESAARDLATLTVELERRRAQLDEERVRRSDLEREVERLERRLSEAAFEREALSSDRAAAEAAAERARQERQAAVRDLKATEARLAARTAEVRDLRQRGSEARDGAESAAPPHGGAADVGAADVGADLDLVELWDRADELAERARALGEAVTALRRSLPRPPSGRPSPSGRDGSTTADRGARRRRPLRVGRGLVEGTVEATEALLAVPGLEVLVDGYNVTLRTWPEVEIAEQRRRLEHGAAALVARTGASITLVYDGAGEGGRPARSVPSVVKVRFTPEDREADDEILDLLDALPIEQSALVVSDDRRVVDGAAARGVNTVSGSVLVELFRR